MSTKKPTTKKSAAKASQPSKAPIAKAPAKKPAPPKKQRELKKLSGLDAAAKVLEESGKPMTTKQMVEAMAAKGYWTSPGRQDAARDIV